MTASEKIKYIRIAALVGVLLLSGCLNLWNIDFPLGYHIDEVKKVQFIQTGQQDFHHPILMLQTNRFLNHFIGFDDAQRTALLGRTVTAAVTTATVFLFFLLCRMLMGNPYDLLASFLFSVCPIVVVHAHYLKEDPFLNMFCVSTLFFFLKMHRNPRLLWTILLGISLGLAFSSHLKGLLLIPVLLISAATLDKTERKEMFRRTTVSLLPAVAVFLIINYPLWFQFDVFKSGVLFETSHVQRGHFLKIRPLDHFFIFHFRESIIPGMTTAAAVITVFSAGFFLLRWPKLSLAERTCLVFILVFYLAVEATPTKPFPGFMRYVLPIVAPLVFFAVNFLQHLLGAAAARSTRFFMYAVLVVVSAMPLRSSFLLDYYFNEKDTRFAALRYAQSSPGKTAFEGFTHTQAMGPVFQHNISDYRKQGIKYLVTGSFWYERAQYGAGLKNQSEAVYNLHRSYQELFRRPFYEIKPAYRSFAFSNPTIRIVDITLPPIDVPENFR